MRTRLGAMSGLAGLVLAGSAAMTLLSPSRTDSLPPNEVETTFVDASGSEVGYKFIGCDGTRIMEGQFSSTKVQWAVSCGGGGGGCAISCFVDGYQVSCSHPIVVGARTAYYGGACNGC